MFTRTFHATLAHLIVATLTPAGVIYQCSCGDYYDPSDPIASYPHNNH